MKFSNDLNFLLDNFSSFADYAIHSDCKSYHSESGYIHSEDSTGFTGLSFAFLYQRSKLTLKILKIMNAKFHLKVQNLLLTCHCSCCTI